MAGLIGGVNGAKQQLLGEIMANSNNAAKHMGHTDNGVHETKRTRDDRMIQEGLQRIEDRGFNVPAEAHERESAVPPAERMPYGSGSDITHDHSERNAVNSHTETTRQPTWRNADSINKERTQLLVKPNAVRSGSTQPVHRSERQTYNSSNDVRYQHTEPSAANSRSDKSGQLEEIVAYGRREKPQKLSENREKTGQLAEKQAYNRGSKRTQQLAKRSAVKSHSEKTGKPSERKGADSTSARKQKISERKAGNNRTEKMGHMSEGRVERTAVRNAAKSGEGTTAQLADKKAASHSFAGTQQRAERSLAASRRERTGQPALRKTNTISTERTQQLAESTAAPSRNHCSMQKSTQDAEKGANSSNSERTQHPTIMNDFVKTAQLAEKEADISSSERAQYHSKRTADEWESASTRHHPANTRCYKRDVACAVVSPNCKQCHRQSAVSSKRWDAPESHTNHQCW